MKALIQIVRGLLFTNIEIPDEIFSTRLFLLSKNESSTPALDKWRPIWIQNIVIRLLEKSIHVKLKSCNCATLKMANYQTGFQQFICVHINIMRAIRLLKTINKKRKGSLFLVDLTSAYDTIPRRIILEAIYDFKNSNLLWEECSLLWAYSSQLLKDASIFHSYQYDIKFQPLEGTFKQKRGVPQGGVLSPVFFNIAFDKILRSNETVNQHIESRNLIAYSDDILIYIPDDPKILIELQRVFEQNGMKINQSKWEYLSKHPTAEISNFGTHKSVCRYLGKYLSLKKSEWKSILIKKIKEQASIYWKVIRAIPIQPARMVAMIHKSISAFHLVPAVLSDDISRNDNCKYLQQNSEKLLWSTSNIQFVTTQCFTSNIVPF